MREVFRMLYEKHPFHGIRFHESKWEGDLLMIVGSEASRIDPGLAAASIRILGERMEKTPDEWVRKWKSKMPKQAQDKILTGYSAPELLRIKWREIEKESAASAGLNLQEMLEQEKEPQQQQEQGSLSFEDEAEQFYRRQEEKEWKRQEMCAFEKAWDEAMASEVGFKDYAAEEQSKYNQRYTVEQH